MNSSTILIIAGLGAVLMALLFLGSSPEPASDQGVVQNEISATSTSVSYYTVAPVVNAGADRSVGEREAFQLAGSGYDPNGLPVTYTWSIKRGMGYLANAHSPTTTFTAPSACTCNDIVVLTLTVTNSTGLSASDDMTITVRDPMNCPTPTCVSSGYREVLPDTGCVKRGSASTCPTPSEPCDSPCITVVPPSGGCASTPVPCPCEGQSSGCWSSWQPGWPIEEGVVAPKDRAQASIDRQFPAQMDESGAIALQGYIRNPACQSVCFTWAADKGWFEGTDTLTPIYHAPPSDGIHGETVTISLIVHDSSGNRSYDQIRIKIRNVNR